MAEGNSGALLAFVRTASEESDQSLGLSPLSACTRTWYSVSAVRPVIVVMVAVPVCVQSATPLHASVALARLWYCNW